MNWMDYQYPSNMANNRLGIVGDQNSLYTTKYGYDPNGNVISDQAPGITAITYDWRNRAIKMFDGANIYLYRYDAAGLRTFRKVIPAIGPTRVQFFIGGMVIDLNGTILRLDISDGFAEIIK